MLTIKIHNDGKQKPQSFEARLSDGSLVGYGSNQMEAIEALNEEIKKRIIELLKTHTNDITYVDCLGQELR